MFDAGKTRMIRLPYGENIWRYVKPLSSDIATAVADPVIDLVSDPVTAAVSVVADPVSDPVTDPAALTHSVQSFYTAKAKADGSVAVLCFH